VTTRARPLRILVTGAAGQLGSELVKSLGAHGEVIATDRTTLDLADPEAIVAAMRTQCPDVVFNAAAYTAVDAAERDEALAHAINATAPGVFAEEARRCGALLVHYSTDYVFDGRASAPYAEDAPANPCNAYGRTKLAGERAVLQSGAAALVLRTSWVYSLHGRNFLTTIMRLARERDEIRVVDDQHGTPNWSRTLARASARLVASGKPWLAERAGLYHCVSGGATTWYGFAHAIVDRMGTAVGSLSACARVSPINTAQYPTPAARPANSVLDDRRFVATFGFSLPPWQEALDECLSGIGDSRA
jgi:dTDP-4-dehydrorhamnose reductase